MVENDVALQEAVIAVMEDPVSYEPVPDRVRRIDTHGAIVFLAGDSAYKMKRALRLPYLDFSTLEKRKRVCEHEIERNRQTAPDLYEDVVPVCRTDSGRLILGGRGEPVEWFVKMRRFDQAGLFDNLAARHELDLALMRPLADRVADYHAAAPATMDATGHDIIARVVEQVASTLAKPVSPVDKVAVASFAKQIAEELKLQSGLLDRRAAAGLVRLCHGDLHLKNIVLLDGEPTLFDAIEFDDAIATIDIYYDLAFLLMDLWFRDLKLHANLFFNRYMATAEPPQALSGLSSLPLFLSVRAGVRAMVGIDLLAQVEDPDTKKAEAEIKRYFDLAVSLLNRAPPRLVAVGGRSGTGKSTLAAGLAPHVGQAPGALHIRSDVERKRMFGVDETERLGADGYAKSATDRVYDRILHRAETGLRAGQSVVLDAVYLLPQQRREVETVARSAGARFTGLWLEASLETMTARVEARTGDASDADARVVEMQSGIDAGPLGWQRIRADGDPDTVLAAARKVLDEGMRVTEETCIGINGDK